MALRDPVITSRELACLFHAAGLARFPLPAPRSAAGDLSLRAIRSNLKSCLVTCHCDCGNLTHKSFVGETCHGLPVLSVSISSRSPSSTLSFRAQHCSRERGHDAASAASSTCPVPLPANWNIVHAEGVKPLPYKTLSFQTYRYRYADLESFPASCSPLPAPRNLSLLKVKQRFKLNLKRDAKNQG